MLSAQESSAVLQRTTYARRKSSPITETKDINAATTEALKSMSEHRPRLSEPAVCTYRHTIPLVVLVPELCGIGHSQTEPASGAWRGGRGGTREPLRSE